MPKGFKGFQKGHPSYLTEESKRKMINALKGKPSGALGKHWEHSEEAKEKISKNNTRY